MALLNFSATIGCVRVLIDLPQEDFVALYIMGWTRVHSFITMRHIKITLSILSTCVSRMIRFEVLYLCRLHYCTNHLSPAPCPLTFHGLVLLTRVSSILWLCYSVIVRVKFIFDSRPHLQHSARPYVVVSLLTCLSSMWERVLYSFVFFLFSLQYLITYVCLLWPELFFFLA